VKDHEDAYGRLVLDDLECSAIRAERGGLRRRVYVGVIERA
jgi:hypothetical protein